jgi:hypothetical protein
MKTATYMEFYESLSFTVWKTGLEVMKELAGQEMKVGHFRGIMYVQLSRWEEAVLIQSRLRNPTDERRPTDSPPRQREYLRISTGTPEKLLEDQSGLEDCLNPV